MKWRTNFATDSQLEKKMKKLVEKPDPKKPSLTVESEAMTVDQIIRRAEEGFNIEERPAHYMSVEDVSHVTRDLFNPHFDLTDLEAIQAKKAELVDAYNKAVENDKIQKEKARIAKLKEQIAKDEAAETATGKEGAE
jgi:hypothetical protein